MNTANTNSNSFPDTILHLVSQFGEGILSDHRIEGLLADTAQTTGYDFSIPVKIASVLSIGKKVCEIKKRNTSIQFYLEDLKKFFIEHSFLKEDVCNFLIDSYAYGVGLIKAINYTYTSHRKVEEQTISHGDYYGSLDPNDNRDGFGMLNMPDGSKFAGEWQLDMRMGFGVSTSISRERYAGQFSFDQKEGIGVQRDNYGSIYAGKWKNGKKQGYGTTYYPNGESLSAIYEDGEIVNSIGSWMLEDNTVVVGKMSAFGPTGECVHILIDGRQRNELWENGKLLMQL